MENVDVITLSELLKRSRSCTSASSLHSASSSRPHAPHGPSPVPIDSGFGPGDCDKDSTFSTLDFLGRRAVLVGRVVLPSEEYLKICKCPSGKCNCLLFFDGDGVICCDVLRFDVGIVEKEIRVCSWNYIHFEGSGGLLEIIDWEFLESVSSGWIRQCSGVSSLRLGNTHSGDCSDDRKARYFAHGFVEAVSPVKVQRIEDKENVGGTCLSGFLVEIMSCECNLCKSKDSEAVFFNISKGGSEGHCYDKRLTVYFFGSMSALHPVITKLVGSLVFLSFLKKKMVFIGRKDCQLMYITSKQSLLRVLTTINRKLLDKSIFCKGKCEIGVYTGVIKGIYEQGKIMELDNEVWLLFADSSASLLHSLRVGALISVQNVHFVKCKFSWTKKLILGGCVRTTITIQYFSPLTASVYTFSRSPSQIGKFIDSLTFSARLWVLLIVALFREKFAGLFSEKEIMGSKNSKGLAQAYASCHLPYSKAKSQNEVFLNFCHHNSSECAGEANNDHLKLALPISKFIQLFGYSQQRKDIRASQAFYEGYNHLATRKIVSSKEINVVLVGTLQISPSTGRLQLVDVTGSIDIVILNHSYNLNAQNIFEVKSYNLIIEDLPAPVDTSVLRDKLFSLKHSFKYSPPSRVNIAPCVFCHAQDVNVVNISKDKERNLNKICHGTFDLIKLTHKFPRLQRADPANSVHISVFAEATRLPWKLVVTSKSSDPIKDCEDGRADVVQHIECNCDHENSYNKRRKCEHGPSNGIQSSIKRSDGIKEEAISFGKDIHIQGCHSGYPIQLPCSVKFRSLDSHKRIFPGFMNLVKSDFLRGCNSTSDAHKILLEFKFDSFLQFEALQIGRYYVVKNDESCASSKNKFYTKVVISQVRRIMSLCFAYYDVDSQGHLQTEMISLRKNTECSTACADLEVHLSSEFRSYLEGDPKHTNEGHLNFLVAHQSICSSLPTGTLISFHGQVVAVISSDQESVIGKPTSESVVAFNHMYHQGSSTYSKIRVLMSNGIVRDLICSGVYSFPLGFGPGVDAHFHRILHSRSEDYLLTPVSFVEITSIRASIKPKSYEHSNLSLAPSSTKFSAFNSVISGLIFQIIQGSKSEPQWIRCRVVAIHILVFEKNDCDAKHVDHKLADCVDIPLAGFILDDGSCTCCCWANADIATLLLKMNKEVPWQAVESRSQKESKATHSTVSHHLKKIVKKQGRITVKIYGSAYHWKDPETIISITSPKFLDKPDKKLIEFLVINACVGKQLNVLVSVMDSEDVNRIENHIREMEMVMPPMPHMWAIEVCSPNPLDEARALFQNLACSHSV